jgi:flavin-binding protein dodecin
MSDAAFQAAAADAFKRAFVPRTSYREVSWASVSLSQTAFVGGVIAIFTREIEQFHTILNSSALNTARPPTQLDPLPIIPVCSRTFPPFVLGLCFDAPLVYDSDMFFVYAYPLTATQLQPDRSFRPCRRHLR